MPLSSLWNVFYPLAAPKRTRTPGKEMEILALGLSRSGTDSLRVALMILGYADVYHGFFVTAVQREDTVFWHPLLVEKYSGKERKVIKGIDFDQCLGHCQAVTDLPTYLFSEELMDYYPKAKVIINRRKNLDAWFVSMQSTVMQGFSWFLWTFGWFDTGMCWLWRCYWWATLAPYDFDFDKNGKRVAIEHYARLDKLVKERNSEYLEWSVEEGWEPLCKFLNKPVPDVPFPDGNKMNGQFEKRVEDCINDLLLNALRNMGICLVTGIAVGAGFWYKNKSA